VLNAEIAAADFYLRPPEQTQQILEELHQQQQALDALLERWTELEE